MRLCLIMALTAGLLVALPSPSALARGGGGSELKALVEVLKKGDRRERDRAATRLQYLADPAAVPMVVRLLETGEPEQRVTASWVLGLLAEPSSTKALVRALKDDDEREVRRNAAYALGAIGARTPKRAKAGAALTKALEDDDRRVRREAATALAVVPAKGAAKKLRRLFEDPDSGVRAAAARSHGKLGARGTKRLAQLAMSDPQNEVRHAATVALGRAGDARYEPSAAALLASLGDRALRDLFAELGLLTRVKNATERLLLPIMEDMTRNRRVRAAAAGALARLRIEAGLRYLVLQSSGEDLDEQDAAMAELRNLDVGDEARARLYQRFTGGDPR